MLDCDKVIKKEIIICVGKSDIKFRIKDIGN